MLYSRRVRDDTQEMVTVKHMKFLVGTLSIGAVLFGTSACILEPDPSPSSSGAAQSDSSSATSSETAEPAPPPEAAELYPALERTPDENDELPVEADLGDITPDSVRLLGWASYAAQFIATDEDDDLCFIAWATPGDGDGTPVDYGTPGIQCRPVQEVQDQGLAVRVDQEKDSDGLVAHLLPPDMEMKQVKKVILAIPGNHEDLRPPVEIMDNFDHSITLAMGTETADDLGPIDIPRPDGSTLTLEPTPEMTN
ncbi:MAG: hypothetical protein L0J08_11940 [Micrococcaceae bacterium]|nr:hypothetical protein [Micrococcaceae bacterium]